MRVLFPLVILAFTLVACGQREGASAPAGTPTAGKPASNAKAPPVLLLAPEDLRTVSASTLATGPVITGSLQPERRADLRAEVSSVVLQVLRHNGEPVKRGDLVVRLDDTALRDALNSADESQRAAEQALAQAERQVQRLRTLQAQGMSSMQALEDAEVRRNQATSEVVAAKARVANARQQMVRTEVRAPFDGVVSERKVSPGDTALVGRELLKVIDPRSLRFEGYVAADRLHELKAGQPVNFRVNGFPGVEFTGRVSRLDASANASTRQVEVVVAFADAAAAPRVAGLFAEGRIETGSAQALMLPEGAVVRSAEGSIVWRLDGERIVRTVVTLGERDARSGLVPVLTGLAEGQRVLRNPGSALVDGQKVELRAAGAPNGAGPSAAAAANAGAAPATGATR
ncbi:MAG: efflux RND transporter periplasmic adaptor subunit [Rubrivivax sp.]|nr:efflux RND transporter periplasmic adaptor subunit [Rubrivivax sp.]